MSFSMDVSQTEPLNLEKPEPEKIEEEVKTAVAVTPEENSALKKLAASNVEQLLNLDESNITQRKAVTSQIESFGADTLKKSADKNSLLSVTVSKLSQNGGTGGEVSKSLTELDKQLKTIDPSAVSFTEKGIFGKLFSPVKDYFKKYEKVDGVISNIVTSLEDGKKTLKNDNTTLEIEEASLRDLTKKLTKEIDMGMAMDEDIQRRLEEAKAEKQPEDKIRFINEEVLYPLRQRVSDMQKLIVVNHQGIIAMEVVRRNNRELIRGVERAQNVTVTALRTAVMVASALYNQKIVLEKLQTLDKTTNDIIASTSRMLKEQGAEIQKQSLESGVSADTLKTAFADALSALDDISRFKTEALPVMQSRIAAFKELADKGEKEIQRLEKGGDMEFLNTVQPKEALK
jgi:uncharacterized protein YaaN involved in tellurite resistance